MVAERREVCSGGTAYAVQARAVPPLSIRALLFGAARLLSKHNFNGSCVCKLYISANACVFVCVQIGTIKRGKKD